MKVTRSSTMKAAMRTIVQMTGLCATVGVVAFAPAGCADHRYLTKAHGRAYSEAFSQQRVYPDGAPATAKGVRGLDSQEAAAVAGAYRRSLSKDGANEAGTGQLVMTNPALGAVGVPYLPPPSVPNSSQ